MLTCPSVSFINVKLTVVIICFFSGSLLSQSNNLLDSMETALSTANKTEKITLLHDLSWKLKYKDADKALAYAKEGLALADTPSIEEGSFLKNIAVIHSIKGELTISDEYSHKAIQVFKDMDNLRLEGTCWGILATNCRKRADYSCALEQQFRVYELMRTIPDSHSMAVVKGNIANIYFEISQYSKAVESYQEVITYARTSEDQTLLANSIGNMARVFSKQGKYPEALELFFESVRIYDRLDNKYAYANSLNEIGVILEKFELYEDAINILMKAETLGNQLGNNIRLGVFMTNIGSCYISMAQFDLALEYLAQAMELYKKAGIEANSSQLINMAICHLNKEKFEKANTLLKAAYETAILKEQEDKAVLATEVKGRVALAQDSLVKAESLLLNASKQWQNLGRTKDLHSATSFLADVYEQKSDFKLALKYQNIAREIEDSLFSIEKNMKVTRMLIREKLDENGGFSEAQEEKQTAENASPKSSFWIKTSILLLVIGSFFLYWFMRNRAKKRQRRLLELNQVNQQLAKELQQKNLELSFFALSNAQKSEFLEKQQLSIKTLAQNYPSDKLVRQLLHAYYFQDVAHKNWESFKSIFEQIAPGFYERLIQHHGKLTSKEIRHCALIRLNISSEDAAILLGISVKSVYKAKYRLRKKLGLSSNQSLEEFIQKI